MSYKFLGFLVISAFIVFFLFVEFTSIQIKPINGLDSSRHQKLQNISLQYIIKSDFCNATISKNMLAILIVTSHFSNVETRTAMRAAFSNKELEEFNMKRVFLLGLSPNDKYTTQDAILQENHRFGDLVQGNFNEAYRNLTYKHVMGLKWASDCKNAKYIIKMDDDIVFNMYKVIKLLQSLKLFRNNLLAGYILHNMSPIRDPTNKWYITKEEYGNPLYPTFVSGWFYITTPSVCEKLATLSNAVPYFWIDDVYITGILALQLKIKHYNLKNHFTVHPEFLQCCMTDVKNFKYDCEVVIGPNGGDTNLFFNFNKIVANCFHGKCRNRSQPLRNTCVAEKKIPIGKGLASVESYMLV